MVLIRHRKENKGSRGFKKSNRCPTSPINTRSLKYPTLDDYGKAQAEFENLLSCRALSVSRIYLKKKYVHSGKKGKQDVSSNQVSFVDKNYCALPTII